MRKKGPRKNKTMSNLKNVMDVKKRPLEAMESNYTGTRKTISKLIAENEKLHQSYSEDVKEMDFRIQEQLQGICNDNKLINLELQRQEKELRSRSNKLRNREVAIEMERNKLAKEIKETEMKKLQEKISYLEKQVNDGNQNLLLEMKHLLGQINVTEHRRDQHVKAHRKIADVVMSLNDKEEERKDLEILSQTLVSQDRKNNDELLDARNELIKGLKEVPNTDIGVMRVRNLGDGLFYDELLKKYNETKEQKKTASGLWSSWRATLLEGVSCLLKIWKEQKRKKIASYFEFE